MTTVSRNFWPLKPAKIAKIPCFCGQTLRPVRARLPAQPTSPLSAGIDGRTVSEAQTPRIPGGIGHAVSLSEHREHLRWIRRSRPLNSLAGNFPVGRLAREPKLLALSGPIEGEGRPLDKPIQAEVGWLVTFKDGGHNARR